VCGRGRREAPRCGDRGGDDLDRQPWIAREPRLSATVMQTVGDKGYDGLLLARVQAMA